MRFDVSVATQASVEIQRASESPLSQARSTSESSPTPAGPSCSTFSPFAIQDAARSLVDQSIRCAPKSKPQRRTTDTTESDLTEAVLRTAGRFDCPTNYQPTRKQPTSALKMRPRTS